MQIRRLLVPALIPAAFLLGTTVNTGIARQAQTDPSVVQVAFMKVDPTKNAEYLALERDIWKPMHQDRIKQGTMRSWTVYSVRFPTGTKREYDYAVVNTYNSLADLDRSMEPVAARIHPKIPIADLARRTYGTRELVRGELWYKVDEAR